jgi:hypothetical protein
VTTPETASARYWRITILTVAPATLLVALAAHPFIEGRLPNQTAIADAVVAGSTRWGVVHLAAGLASALIALAFLAVRQYLHDAGEDRLSGLGMPLVIVGSTLYAVLPGMEFAALAAAETDATTAGVAEVQDAIRPWFTPVLIASSLTFGLGAISFAGAIRASRIASAGTTQVVGVGLIVMALSRIVPLSVTQFYIHGLAALVALWPLAYVTRTRRVPSGSPYPQHGDVGYKSAPTTTAS